MAAKHGHAECLYHLLKFEDIDINEKWDNSESTPLMAAWLNARIDAIKLLTYKGADHTLRNRNDDTALDWAAMSENTRAFLRIIQKFVKLNNKENSEEFNALFNHENKVWGLTLLTRLVLDGKYKVAKLLFNSKVNVNYQHSRDGDSVLHKAIKSGNKKAIGFWLYIGWNKDLANHKGDSFNSFLAQPEYEFLKKIQAKVPNIPHENSVYNILFR